MIEMSAEGSHKIFLNKKYLPFIIVLNLVGLIICHNSINMYPLLRFLVSSK